MTYQRHKTIIAYSELVNAIRRKEEKISAKVILN